MSWALFAQHELDYDKFNREFLSEYNASISRCLFYHMVIVDIASRPRTGTTSLATTTTFIFISSIGPHDNLMECNLSH
jgi:hypothetical protein